MELFNMCQYEKAFNYYQKQVDVCSAKILAGAEVKERNSVGFQNNLTTKISPDTEIPQADLAHLKEDEHSLIEPIMKEYSSLFR